MGLLRWPAVPARSQFLRGSINLDRELPTSAPEHRRYHGVTLERHRISKPNTPESGELSFERGDRRTPTRDSDVDGLVPPGYHSLESLVHEEINNILGGSTTSFATRSKILGAKGVSAVDCFEASGPVDDRFSTYVSVSPIGATLAVKKTIPIPHHHRAYYTN